MPKHEPPALATPTEENQERLTKLLGDAASTKVQDALRNALFGAWDDVLAILKESITMEISLDNPGAVRVLEESDTPPTIWRSASFSELVGEYMENVKDVTNPAGNCQQLAQILRQQADLLDQQAVIIRRSAKHRPPAKRKRLRRI